MFARDPWAIAARINATDWREYAWIQSGMTLRPVSIAAALPLNDRARALVAIRFTALEDYCNAAEWPRKGDTVFRLFEAFSSLGGALASGLSEMRGQLIHIPGGRRLTGIGLRMVDADLGYDLHDLQSLTDDVPEKLHWPDYWRTAWRRMLNEDAAT